MSISLNPLIPAAALSKTQSTNNNDAKNDTSNPSTGARQKKIDEKLSDAAKLAIELEDFSVQLSEKITAANKVAVDKSIAKAKANREEDADDEGEE
jgi:hypothetical protein